MDTDKNRTSPEPDPRLSASIRGSSHYDLTDAEKRDLIQLIRSSRKSGALRRQIEDAGGLKLIYIDPLFGGSA